MARPFASLRLCLCLSALASLPTAAQPAPNRLYINSATLVTTTRLIGLGGASVGLAENTESLPFNYAAAGNRSPRRKRQWDWDVTFALLTSPADGWRDVDNEGPGQPANFPLDAQFGGLLQIKRIGFGAYFRSTRRNVCDVPPCTDDTLLRTQTTQGAFVFGISTLQDQLIIGAGLNLARADFGAGPLNFTYLGWGGGGGILVRPHFLPFRIGVSAVTNTVGKPTFALSDGLSIAGRALFTEVVTPGRVSVGATYRLGPGSWRYNRLSPPAVRAFSDLNPAELPHDIDEDPRAPGRLLLSAQVDFIFPVSNATNLSSFLYGTVPPLVGNAVYVVPRTGAEYEVFENRLRARLGGYLEPAFINGQAARPHGTLGFELFLFHLLAPWSVGAAVDIAPRYFSVSVGLGWWNAG